MGYKYKKKLVIKSYKKNLFDCKFYSAFFNLSIKGIPKPEAGVKNPPKFSPPGKLSERAIVKADSHSILEVDLYPGSPSP